MLVALILLGSLLTLSLGLFTFQKSKLPALRHYGTWILAAVVALIAAAISAAAPLIDLGLNPVQEATNAAFLIDEALPILAFHVLLVVESVLLARWLETRTETISLFLVAHIPTSAMLWLLTFLVAAALLPDS